MSADVSRVSIGFSNLNTTPKDWLVAGADDYLQMLKAGGYDQAAGIEWSDIRLPSARRAARTLANMGLIPVVHESWREVGLPEASAELLRERQAAIEQFGGAVVLPLLDKSYVPLKKLQKTAGHALPIIVHPPGQHLDNQSPRRPRLSLARQSFAELWYQPTAEWAASQNVPLATWDVQETAQAIIAAQTKQGLGGIALDLHHLTMQRAGQQFQKPIELAAALAQDSSLREIQLAIRPNFGGYQETLIKALTGKLAQTEAGEMLIAIHESIPKTRQLRIVTEIAAGDIAALKITDRNEAHTTITHSIRQICNA